MVNSPKSPFCHFVIRTEWVNLAALTFLSEGEKVGGKKQPTKAHKGRDWAHYLFSEIEAQLRRDPATMRPQPSQRVSPAETWR
jgi:hypothetical protein